ncbi:hypothetical protein AB0H73_18640 [Streptomyces olivoreticuli]
MPKVQVTVCDVCKRVGVETRRYKITEGERSVETDRCRDHGQPFEEALDPETQQVKSAHADLTAEPASAPSAPAKKTPAKRAAAKKAATKKATVKQSQSSGRRRGPVLTTIEEINATKKK